MSEKIIIAVDAMGGDHAPQAIVEGVKLAAAADPALDFVLVGREGDIRACLGEDADRFRIVHTDEVIDTGEDPLIAIRKKRNASMLIAFDLLKKKEVQAVVSAGSTGAFLSGALFRAGRIKGIQRPALAPVFPTKRGGAMLIDCGANAECTPEFLKQFALMGTVYMKNMFGIENPRVALINNGAEEEKGTPLYKQTHQALKASGLNFVGNLEPRYIPDGDADVMVCDGFAGNMVLKSYEGAMMYLFDLLKEEMMSSLPNKLAAAVLKKSFKRVKKKLDFNEVGGAPLVGIDGCVVKAHGSSKAQPFANALAQAATMVRTGVVDNIKRDIEAFLEQ
ncbi:MAG: phosphate acyltransferase PlsX [Eubacteriales bacterium]|nr:phosphate acyltransferase PlsX [Eubacteriales bacterium]